MAIVQTDLNQVSANHPPCAKLHSARASRTCQPSYTARLSWACPPRPPAESCPLSVSTAFALPMEHVRAPRTLLLSPAECVSTAFRASLPASLLAAAAAARIALRQRGASRPRLRISYPQGEPPTSPPSSSCTVVMTCAHLPTPSFHFPLLSSPLSSPQWRHAFMPGHALLPRPPHRALRFFFFSARVSHSILDCTALHRPV